VKHQVTKPKISYLFLAQMSDLAPAKIPLELSDLVLVAMPCLVHSANPVGLLNQILKISAGLPMEISEGITAVIPAVILVSILAEIQETIPDVDPVGIRAGIMMEIPAEIERAIPMGTMGILMGTMKEITTGITAETMVVVTTVGILMAIGYGIPQGIQYSTRCGTRCSIQSIIQLLQVVPYGRTSHLIELGK
jgi:hypothetical protein